MVDGVNSRPRKVPIIDYAQPPFARRYRTASGLGGRRHQSAFVASLLIVSVIAAGAISAMMGADQVGSEFPVNTYTVGDQISPSVALNTSGNSLVVWSSWRSDWGGYAVYAQMFDDSGTKIRGQFPVNNGTSDNQLNASVSMAADGSSMVVWQTTRDPQSNPGTYNNGICIKYYDPECNSSAVVIGPVEDDPDEYDPACDLGTLSTDWIIVWTELDQDGSGEGIYGMGSDLGFAHAPLNTYTSGDQDSASVAMAPDGSFVVVWRSDGQDGDSGGIYGQQFLGNGSKSGPEFGVNSYLTGDQAQPSVAVDSGGNFVVVWSSLNQDGNGWGVYGQRFSSSGAKIGSEFRVNTYTSGNQIQPSASVSSSGEFVVVWSSNGPDGSGSAVVGQRYYSDGAALGVEFVANSFTGGNQMQPSVSTNGVGSFLVVWQSDGQDGSGWGVFGQLYNQAPIPEFPSVLVPIVITALCLMAFGAARRSRNG